MYLDSTSIRASETISQNKEWDVPFAFSQFKAGRYISDISNLKNKIIYLLICSFVCKQCKFTNICNSHNIHNLLLNAFLIYIYALKLGWAGSTVFGSFSYDISRAVVWKGLPQWLSNIAKLSEKLATQKLNMYHSVTQRLQSESFP